jgi:beta-mannosidase
VDAWSSQMVGLPGAVSAPGSPERELLLAHAGTARAWWWFVTDRDFDYRVPSFDVDVEQVAEVRHRVALVADVLVRDLALFVDRISPAAEVDCQLITALPGEPIELQVTRLTDLDATALTRRPVCRTANDLVAGRR